VGRKDATGGGDLRRARHILVKLLEKGGKSSLILRDCRGGAIEKGRAGRREQKGAADKALKLLVRGGPLDVINAPFRGGTKTGVGAPGGPQKKKGTIRKEGKGSSVAQNPFDHRTDGEDLRQIPLSLR